MNDRTACFVQLKKFRWLFKVTWLYSSRATWTTAFSKRNRELKNLDNNGAISQSKLYT